MAGQPKKFQDGKQLIELWTQYCREIKEKGYDSAPTQTNFSYWLNERFNKVDVRTIYNSLNEYFPNIKKDFESIRADVISEGTMLGKYQPTMSIFALKNWCSWKDKQEITQETTIGLSDGFIEALNGTAANDWSEDDEVEDSNI